MNKIKEENWNYTYFTEGDKRAFISLIGEPINDDVVFFYGVTVTDSNDRTLSQQRYASIPEAVEFINNKYCSWSFNDPTIKNESGCSTCVAH